MNYSINTESYYFSYLEKLFVEANCDSSTNPTTNVTLGASASANDGVHEVATAYEGSYAWTGY